MASIAGTTLTIPFNIKRFLYDERPKPLLFALAFAAIGSGAILWAWAATNTYSFWPNTTRPAIVSSSDPKSIEVGLKFTAKYAGQISGIRFYKGTKDTGTHSGTLWTSNGTELAHVTFKNESTSGWQTAMFPQAVSIAANVTYVISYHAPNGHYAYNNNYFAKTHTAGPLTAPSSTTAHGNGVYAYSRATKFPNLSYRATNYWVDVIFTTATQSKAPAPPVGVTAVQNGTSIIVSWQAAQSANPLSKYVIFRNGSQLASVNGTTLSYTDTNLTAGTTYAYQVKAVDNTNTTSILSTIATVTYNVVPTPTPVPTPSPTPTPPPNTSCSSGTPTFAGCGFPSATTTGVVNCSTLPEHTGNTNITTDGTVINGWNLVGSLDIYANNVTVENSCITSSNWWGVNQRGSNSGMKVLHNTIVGKSGAGPDSGCEDYGVNNMADGNSMTVTGNNISGYVDGISTGGGSLTDNYIHDLTSCKVPGGSGITHNQDIYASGDADIEHNTLLIQLGYNSGSEAAISLWSTLTNSTVNNNWLAGGNYTIYLDPGASNVKVTNNLFSTEYWNSSLQRGTLDDNGQQLNTGGRITWTGNKWADGPKAGATVTGQESP